MLEFCHVVIHRNRANTTRHNDTGESAKLIPFSFTIKLPLPLKRGVDYGFRAAKTAL